MTRFSPPFPAGLEKENGNDELASGKEIVKGFPDALQVMIKENNVSTSTENCSHTYLSFSLALNIGQG